MAEVTAAMVKELRAKTGAGMMDCKSALIEAQGSMDDAIEVLRKRGLKSISKRSGKSATEGTLGVYVHAGGRIVSVVELNSETDFVSRGDGFKELAHDLAMHVAAMQPQYVTVEEIPEAVLEKEREILTEQLNEKQREKADKILPGKLEKFYEDTVLMRQKYVKDDTGKKSVEEIVQELSMKVGEKVVVRRFVRLEVGEGLEREEGSFVEEIAAMTSAN